MLLQNNSLQFVFNLSFHYKLTKAAQLKNKYPNYFVNDVISDMQISSRVGIMNNVIKLKS